MIGIANPKLQALSDGLWTAVQKSSVSPVEKSKSASGAAGLTLEDLTIAKVGRLCTAVMQSLML